MELKMNVELRNKWELPELGNKPILQRMPFVMSHRPASQDPFTMAGNWTQNPGSMQYRRDQTT